MTLQSIRITSMVLAISAFFFSRECVAESVAQYYIPDVPSDMGKVDFYLMTVGVGDDLAARYGHTGIRVVNHLDKTDVVFNWGKFYFDDPMFVVNFYRGDLTYSMGVRSYRRDIAHHEADERMMLQEKINLTERQKRRLLEKIAWNSRPENRDFKYQYWYKNCSTIPRDYLDEVLERQVRAKFYRPGSGKTFRQYVRSNLSLMPGMIPVLDTIMNSRIDREITQWEEMFLPGKLREHLLTMSAVDEDGNMVVGKPLLSDTQVLLSYPENLRDYRPDYYSLGGGLWLGLGGVLYLLLWERKRGRGKIGIRLLGAFAMAWGALSGFFGLAMSLNWMFSGHEDIWHNANLLLFTPMDFVFALIGYKLIRNGAPVKDRFPFARGGEALAWLHAAMFLALAVAKVSGLVEQNVYATMFWIGMPSVVFVLLLARYGLVQYQSAKAESKRLTGELDFRSERQAERVKVTKPR